MAAAHPDNPLIQQLAALPASQILGALDLLSPEDLAAIFTSGFAVSHVQLDNIEHRLWDARQGATGFSDSGFRVTDHHPTYATDAKDMLSGGGKEVVSPVPPVILDKSWGFFISGSGEVADVENTGTARGSSFETGGVTVGADYRLTPHFILGAAFGYAHNSAALNLGGSIRSDSGTASLYGTYYNGGFYVNGIAGAGYGSIETRRLTLGGIARGDTNGTNFNALLGTGYDYHLGPWTLGPLVSLRYSRFGIDSFTEEGALGSLGIRSQSENSLLSTIGGQASYTAAVCRIPVTPFIRLQWEHELLTSTPRIDAGFTSADTFSVQGPRIGRDGLLLEAGVSAQLTPRIAIFTYYSGDLRREHYTSHTVTGGLRFNF